MGDAGTGTDQRLVSYEFDADTLVFLSDALEVAASCADERDQEQAIRGKPKPKMMFAVGAALREYARRFKTDANRLEAGER